MLSHWIIIALEASDILRDKFSMRVIIQCPYYGSDKKVASFILEAILGEPFHSVMSNLKNYRDRIFPCAVKKKEKKKFQGLGLDRSKLLYSTACVSKYRKTLLPF